MIVVTGGAGFIGSNLVLELNRRGHSKILVVDDFSDGTKAANLSTAVIADYLDRDEVAELLGSGGEFPYAVEQVFHLGACTDTTEWDGQYMMANNFTYSKLIFEYCVQRQIPFVYASSAAVYGANKSFAESAENEAPLNVYGYSKLALDQYVRACAHRISSLVVGLRYFNVYGPREAHKRNMASVAWHWYHQAVSEQCLRIFEGSHGYAAGEQCRDFVHVDDVVDVTLWAGQQSAAVSGIYNCGTGRAETFNAVAAAVVTAFPDTRIDVIPIPETLHAAYQPYTQADLTRLRAAGYHEEFRDVATGMGEYIRWLNS